MPCHGRVCVVCLDDRVWSQRRATSVFGFWSLFVGDLAFVEFKCTRSALLENPTVTPHGESPPYKKTLSNLTTSGNLNAH